MKQKLAHTRKKTGYISKTRTRAKRRMGLKMHFSMSFIDSSKNFDDLLTPPPRERPSNPKSKTYGENSFFGILGQKLSKFGLLFRQSEP